MSEKAERITNLCDAWITAARQPGGGLEVGATSEQHRLFANEIRPHELDYDDMRAAAVGLTRVLLHPGMNTVIDLDHYLFWAWSAEIVLNIRGGYFSEEEYEIRELLNTAMRAVLSTVRGPVANDNEWKAQVERDRLIPHNLRELRAKTSIVVSYLCFPLLEAILRKRCSTYVSLAGEVREEFSVPNWDHTGTKTYSPNEGSRCNSLRDMLWLFHEAVADTEMSQDLDALQEHLKLLTGADDGYNVIGNWRNSSLHGETTHPTIGGTLLNIALLLILNAMVEQYDELAAAALEQVRWQQQVARPSDFRSPWSYYPPF